MGSVGQWAPETLDIFCVFLAEAETPAANKCVLSVVLPRGFVESRVPQF